MKPTLPPLFSRVGFKVSTAIGVVIAMHLIVVFMSHYGLSQAKNIFALYTERHTEVFDILEIDKNVAELKHHVAVFLYNQRADSADRVRILGDTLQAQLDNMLVTTQDEQDREDLQLMVKQFHLYMNCFEDKTQINANGKTELKSSVVDPAIQMTYHAEQFTRLSSDIKSRNLVRVSTLARDMTQDESKIRMISNIAGLFTVMIGMFASTWLRRDLVPPLKAITQTLTRLAKGDRDIVIPGLSRHDEIGQMATAAEVFLKKASQTKTLLQVSQQLQRDLRETEARYRSAFDNAPIGVGLLNLDGAWISANHMLLKILGYSPEELLSMRLNDVNHPEDAPFDTERLEPVLTGTTPTRRFYNRFIHKDGHNVWVQLDISLVRDQEGKPKYFITQLQDISERKQIELLLTQYRHGVDQAAIVAVTDVEGIITHVNDKFCEISQYSREELIGKNHRIVNSGLHPKEFFTKMFKTLVSDNLWHGEVCNRAKDGSLYWVDTTIVAFRDVNGKIDRYLAIRSDITEQKKSIHQLQGLIQELEDKTAEMEQFTYTVSHDLKSPLVSCAGLVDCIREDLAAGEMEEAYGSLDRMTRSIGRMEGCLKDLLELSRVGRVRHEPEWVDINTLLRDMIDDMTPRLEQAEATCEINSILPPVYADPVRIGEVFENLISNALKYGCVKPGVKITIGHTTVDHNLRFFVHDSGPGIPKQYQEKIFGLFQRLSKDKEGSGVGLTIVSRIMEIHEGRIWVESKEGQGATFWVEFPRERIQKLPTAA